MKSERALQADDRPRYERLALPTPEVEPWRKSLARIESVQILDGCLLVKVIGPLRARGYTRVLDQIGELIIEHKPRTVLADLRFTTGIPSMADRFQVNKHLAERVVDLGIFTPLVCCTRKDIFDPHRFPQVVAANRGVHFEYTADIDEALFMAGLSVSSEDLYPSADSEGS